MHDLAKKVGSRCGSIIEQEVLNLGLIIVAIGSRSISRVNHGAIDLKPTLLQQTQRLEKRIALNPSPIHLVARQNLILIELPCPVLECLQILLRAPQLVRVKLVVHVVYHVRVPHE